MKTAQETKTAVLEAAGEQTQAIKNFLEGLGFKRIFITCQLCTTFDESEESVRVFKRDQLHITADYC
jgi:hypothetical protein